ncbi:MAG: PASTA domain-containing protein [Clostridia bacterium]|nr:PASTA domain-containing protein [Clostridia bacterium]
MIVRAHIVGIREAHQTIGDTTYNSTNYSVLVEESGGTIRLVEGDIHDISHLLPYMSVPNSDAILQELRDLKASMAQQIHQEVARAISSLHPMPVVTGLPEDEAITRLQNAGFAIHLVNTYPAGTPKGQVYACHRNDDMLMTAELDIRHALPDTAGMTASQAADVLRKAGFQVHVERVMRTDVPDNTLLKVTRQSEVSLLVTLEMAVQIPDVTGLTEAEAVEQLKASGFVGVVQGKEYTDTTPAGRVISWAKASDGTVSLVVSAGVPLVKLAPSSIQPDPLKDLDPGLNSLNALMTLDRKAARLEITLYGETTGGKQPRLKLSEKGFSVTWGTHTRAAEKLDIPQAGREKVAVSGVPILRLQVSLPDSKSVDPIPEEIRLTVTRLAGLTQRPTPWTVRFLNTRIV